MFLLLTLFGNSVLAGNALVDVCCLVGDAPSTYNLVDDSDTDPCDANIVHCCHASAHYSALGMPGSDIADRALDTTWPVMTVRQIAFLPHTPPVPPPNA